MDYLPDGRHKPDSWWLDNGKDEWKVGRLSPEQQHYPYRQITPALAVRDLVERGWDPEWEFKGADAKEFREPAEAKERSPHSPASTFFLYFRTAGDATHAREQIVRERSLFTSADVDSSDDDVVTARHSLILKTSANFDLADLEHFLETVADRFGGVYDGNELPLRR
ncbi:MAG TPA: hypothetical protein VFE35_05900 [Candidatus Cybelea sp.]|nr:hypothetical protein [Candidatus Cybelea sp.]